MPIQQSAPLNDATTLELLCKLLGDWHARGWVSGTGGGVCGPTEDDNLFLAPTGVHKELVRPEDFFVVAPADGSVVRQPKTQGLRPSECNSIFCLIARERGARSVAHSHSLSAVLAGDLPRNGDCLEIADLEMLKGIRGLSNRDRHAVPVIANTEREPELVAELTRVLADKRFGATFAVVVRDHGAYIWGADVWETKRHVEVYQFLFEATVARRAQTMRT